MNLIILLVSIDGISLRSRIYQFTERFISQSSFLNISIIPYLVWANLSSLNLKLNYMGKFKTKFLRIPFKLIGDTLEYTYQGINLPDQPNRRGTDRYAKWCGRAPQ